MSLLYTLEPSLDETNYDLRRMFELLFPPGVSLTNTARSTYAQLPLIRPNPTSSQGGDGWLLATTDTGTLELSTFPDYAPCWVFDQKTATTFADGSVLVSSAAVAPPQTATWLARGDVLSVHAVDDAPYHVLSQEIVDPAGRLPDVVCDSPLGTVIFQTRSLHWQLSPADANGRVWKQGYGPFPAPFHTLVWEGTQFVGVSATHVWTSPDLVTWNQEGDVPFPSDNDNDEGIYLWGDERGLLLRTASGIWSSSDARTWTPISTPDAPLDSIASRMWCTPSSLILASKERGLVWTLPRPLGVSAASVPWTTHVLAAKGPVVDVASGGTCLLCVCASKETFLRDETIPDAPFLAGTPVPFHPTHVAWDESAHRFLVLGLDRYAWSPDGHRMWRSALLSTRVQGPRALVFAPNRPGILLSDTRQYLFLLDSDQVPLPIWRELTGEVSLCGICASSLYSRFVACGMNGQLGTSTDGVEWHWQSLGDVRQVAWSPRWNLFLAVGDDGVWQSPDGLRWERTDLVLDAPKTVAWIAPWQAFLIRTESRTWFTYDGRSDTTAPEVLLPGPVSMAIEPLVLEGTGEVFPRVNGEDGIYFTSSSGSDGLEALFDESEETSWISEATFRGTHEMITDEYLTAWNEYQIGSWGQWIQLEFPDAVPVDRIQFHGRVQNAFFLGSHTGVQGSWELITRIHYDSADDPTAEHDIDLFTVSAYRFYRLHIERIPVEVDSEISSVRLTRLQLYDQSRALLPVRVDRGRVLLLGVEGGWSTDDGRSWVAAPGPPLVTAATDGRRVVGISATGELWTCEKDLVWSLVETVPLPLAPQSVVWDGPMRRFYVFGEAGAWESHDGRTWSAIGTTLLSGQVRLVHHAGLPYRIAVSLETTRSTLWAVYGGSTGASLLEVDAHTVDGFAIAVPIRKSAESFLTRKRRMLWKSTCILDLRHLPVTEDWTGYVRVTHSHGAGEWRVRRRKGGWEWKVVDDANGDIYWFMHESNHIAVCGGIANGSTESSSENVEVPSSILCTFEYIGPKTETPSAPFLN